MTRSHSLRSLAAWLRADWPGLAVAALVLVAAHVAYAPVAGFVWDDGVYVAAGRALAEGHGYALPGRVGLQAVPQYPAGYPLIVSLAWRALGSTAAVLRATALLSALSMGAAWYLWWRLIRREHGHWAIALVGIPAFAYASLAVATQRMSDAPYALLVALAATLWTRGERSRAALAATVVIAAVAPALRTAGAVLPASVFLLLVAHRRWRWAAALAVAAAAVQIALGTLLRAPQPTYGELTRAAWAEGGAGWTVLVYSLGRGVWQAFAAFLVPPLTYSGAVRTAITTSALARGALVVALVAIGGAVLWGGWRRLRSGRWGVGDVALLGALALPFVAPMGMDGRFIVPYGAVIPLWAFEAARRAMGRAAARAQRPRATGRPGFGARLAGVAPTLVAIAFSLVGAATLVEAVHVTRSVGVVARERSRAYLAQARAARAWLGRRGLLVAEFPESLWLLGGIRAVSTTSALENVLSAGAAEREVRRQVDAVGRGCLLDTRTYATSRAVFDTVAARPGAAVLPTSDARYVRAVCWHGRGDAAGSTDADQDRERTSPAHSRRLASPTRRG